MTLPEHIVCSVMIAQFGVRQRFGWKGVAAVAAAGVAPDLDAVTKLAGDAYYWKLHHALGHGIVPVLVLSEAVALVARSLGGVRPLWYVWLWCLIAASAHVLTDALYWWEIKLLWPFGRWEICFRWIEYLDLLVLVLWLIGAFCLYRFPASGVRVASVTLGLFAAYVLLRAVAPQPERGSLIHFVTGGWMYEPPRGTPFLEWW